jgi:hypothetical protein
MSRAHPARSLEFLSRLHDGELSAAERAHFESHRAHCVECRRAAAEFEEAIASFRTAGTSPPASDLAARILRRLEASNPRRRPFGVVFGIDLKWAGAFTAAIVAVIAGYSIASRHERPRPIPVSLATPAAPKPAAPAPPASSEAGPDAKREDELLVARANPPAEPARAAAEPQTPAPAFDARKEDFPARQVSAESPAADARAGGEGRQKLAKKEAGARPAAAPGSSAAAPSIRITAAPLDGEGPAPAILNAGELTLTAADRGEYVLVVAPAGQPLEVARAGSGEKDRDASLRKPAGDPLRRLRFAAAAGPRRLLVRVE